MANIALNRTTQVLLTNKSGGTLNYGDVVVLDNTNANSFTTTTTAGLSTRGLGVILEPNGIGNNAQGMVAVGGWCPRLNLNTAATVGQFIKTHTVAGQGTPHSSPQGEGDFAVVLEASANPACALFGSPNGPNNSSPGGSPGDLQYNNSGLFGGITVVPGTQGGGLVLLEQHVASGSSTLDFTAFISSSYSTYKIIGSGITLSTSGANLFLQVGTGGGPTYQTSAYEWGFSGFATSGLGTSYAGTVGSPELLKNVGTTAGWAAGFELLAENLRSVSLRKPIFGLTKYVNASPQSVVFFGQLEWTTTGTAVTAIRFAPNTGTFSGAIQIFGVAQ